MLCRLRLLSRKFSSANNTINTLKHVSYNLVNLKLSCLLCDVLCVFFFHIKNILFRFLLLVEVFFSFFFHHLLLSGSVERRNSNTQIRCERKENAKKGNWINESELQEISMKRCDVNSYLSSIPVCFIGIIRIFTYLNVLKL